MTVFAILRVFVYLPCKTFRYVKLGLPIDVCFNYYSSSVSKALPSVFTLFLLIRLFIFLRDLMNKAFLNCLFSS